MPVRRRLEGMRGACKRVLGKMRTDQLHAQRHPICSHPRGQRDRRAPTEVEYGGQPQDTQQDTWIGAILTHLCKRRNRHGHRRDQQQVDILAQCRQTAGELQPLVMDGRDVDTTHRSVLFDQLRKIRTVLRLPRRIRLEMSFGCLHRAHCGARQHRLRDACLPRAQSYPSAPRR